MLLRRKENNTNAKIKILKNTREKVFVKLIILWEKKNLEIPIVRNKAGIEKLHNNGKQLHMFLMREKKNISKFKSTLEKLLYITKLKCNIIFCNVEFHT